MFQTILEFSFFGVVEAVYATDKIACDTPNSLKGRAAIGLFASALRANILDDAVVAANGVMVNRMINGTVSDASVFHMQNEFFERLQI